MAVSWLIFDVRSSSFCRIRFRRWLGGRLSRSSFTNDSNDAFGEEFCRSRPVGEERQGTGQVMIKLRQYDSNGKSRERVFPSV